MKIRIGILALGVIMSAPAAAMRYRAMPESVSYKTPALIGGALLAAYGVAWIYDWITTEKKLAEIHKKIKEINNHSKMYAWCIQKYDPSRSIEYERNSATFTKHGSRYEDKFNYVAFANVERDLMIDYWKGEFGYLDAQNKYEDDKKAKIRQYLLDFIIKEKKELEPHLDELVKMSAYFGRWHNTRKDYKEIAKKQALNPYQQWQWTHKQHENVNNAMQATLGTNLFHLLLGKSMYGKIARIYWDLEKRYQRLEKIERCLIDLLGTEQPQYIAEKERITKRHKEHDKQDQLFKDWIVSPLFS